MMGDNKEIEKGNSTMVKNTLPDTQEINGLPVADHFNLLFQQEYNKLSQRAQNTLEDINICNFSNARDYYIIHQGKIDFMYVKNAGEKTNAELIIFFEVLKVWFRSENEINNEETESKKCLAEISGQSEHDKNIPEFNAKTELYFQAKFKKISNRSKNILSFINADTVRGFYHYFFIEYPNNLNLNLKNCGVVSANEIIKFKKIVEELIDQYSSDSFKSGLFSDLEFYYRESESFNDRYRGIFNRCFKIHESDKFTTLVEIGKDYNLTKERIRQIATEFRGKYMNVLSQITKNGFTDLNQYFKGEYFIIDDVYAETINSKEGTNFSKHIICFTLSQIIPDDYRYYTLNNNQKEFSGIFYRKDLLLDVKACMDLIREFNLNPQKSTFIKIELEKILENSGFKPDTQDVNVSFLQAKRQLVEIIGLYNSYLPDTVRKVNIHDNFLIIKNKSEIHYSDHIFEVLRASKKPLHFKEIHRRLIENNVSVSSLATILSTLIIHPEYFGFKGNGHYGLREWGGYFGTIGDVTEQILRERNNSIHYLELIDILCSELFISRASILQVLLRYKNENRFVKLNNGTIALKSWVKK